MKRNRSSLGMPLVPWLLFALILHTPTAAVALADGGSVQSFEPAAVLKGGGLFFIPNRGQLDPEAHYVLRGGDKTLFFTSQGVTLLLKGPRPAVAGRKERAALIDENNLSRNWAARLEFVGAEPVIPRGRLSTPTQISFFKGTPDQWRTGLPTYAELIYEGLWPGVDLVFSGAAGRIKYAFIVHPGADPERIRLVHSGLLGGSDYDYGYGIAVDGLGQAYVTGATYSANFPRTVGFPHAGGGEGCIRGQGAVYLVHLTPCHPEVRN